MPRGKKTLRLGVWSIYIYILCVSYLFHQQFKAPNSSNSKLYKHIQSYIAILYTNFHPISLISSYLPLNGEISIQSTSLPFSQQRCTARRIWKRKQAGISSASAAGWTMTREPTEFTSPRGSTSSLSLESPCRNRLIGGTYHRWAYFSGCKGIYPQNMVLYATGPLF